MNLLKYEPREEPEYFADHDDSNELCDLCPYPDVAGCCTEYDHHDCRIYQALYERFWILEK